MIDAGPIADWGKPEEERQRGLSPVRVTLGGTPQESSREPKRYGPEIPARALR